MVVRTEDKHDRRARIVALTPAGHDAFATAQLYKRKAMDEIFGSLSAHERANLAALLTTVRTNLPSGDSTCGD